MVKKFIIAGFILVLVLIAGLTVRQQSMGSVTVTASNPAATISVTNVSNGSVVDGVGEVVVRGQGTYGAVAKDDTSASYKLFEVTDGEHGQQLLTLRQAPEVNNLINYPATNINVPGRDINFLHPEAGTILSGRSDGTVSNFIFDLPLVLKLFWTGPQEGVVFTRNSRFLHFDKSSFTEVSVPSGFNPSYSSTPLSTTLDGHLAMVVDGELYFYANTSAKPKRLVSGLADNSTVNISPDGSLIAYFEHPPEEFEHEHGDGDEPELEPEDYQLRFALFDTKTGDVVHEESVKNQPAVTSVTWSPDGARLVYAQDGAITTQDIATGQRNVVFRFSTGRITDVVVVPDRDDLVVNISSEIWQVTPSTSEAFLLAEVDQNSIYPSSLYLKDNQVLFGVEDEQSFKAGWLRSAPLY